MATTPTRLTAARPWAITGQGISTTGSSWAWAHGPAGATDTAGAAIALPATVAETTTAGAAMMPAARTGPMGKAAATGEMVAARSIQIVEGSVRARVNRPTEAADRVTVTRSLMVAGNLTAADNLMVADRVMAANRTGAEKDTPDNRFLIHLC